MKISIINRRPSLPWEVQQLIAAGEKGGHEVEVRDIKDVPNIPELVKSLGEVVIWRSATINANSPYNILNKATFLELMRDKTVLNAALARKSFLPAKFSQQKLVGSFTNVRTIPTWQFATASDLKAALADGRLTLPLIVKPNISARGEGVRKLAAAEDVDTLPENIGNCVVQPFLKNKGDYRVLVLGGVILGAMKRTSPAGSFLNNISKGGRAEAVTDKAELTKLYSLANEIINVVDLTFFGVDILYCETDQQWYFLEINTVPQWQAFEKVAGISVALHVIQLCEALTSRKKQPMGELIKRYYLEHLQSLDSEKGFHFLQRLAIGKSDEEAAALLKEHRSSYIGSSEEATVALLKNMMHKPADINFSDRRSVILEHYPNLIAYQRAFFALLAAKTVFHYDLRFAFNVAAPAADLRAYFDSLSTSPDHLALLSTYGVNFLYLFRKYFPRESSALNLPQYILEISRTHYSNEISQDDLHLNLYLLTHAIIGASSFYTEKITQDMPLYVEMLRIAEQLILTHYHDLSLDIKFEFLVCAQLCNQETVLRDVIMSEAENSWSPLGNYLIDTLNTKAARSKTNFNHREHANVLFLLSQKTG